MDKKTIVIILGVILILAGIVAMIHTEPAGDDGSEASRGIADVSEDERPYLWYGIALISSGIILSVVAAIKMS